METTDFTIKVDKYGYQISYKGHSIGGAGTIRGVNKRYNSKQVGEYYKSAKRDIEYIVAGKGEKRYTETIQEIDNFLNSKESE